MDKLRYRPLKGKSSRGDKRFFISKNFGCIFMFKKSKTYLAFGLGNRRLGNRQTASQQSVNQTSSDCCEAVFFL